ncbi:MAG: 16S rRNA (guanine(527)-N(7))-methyltransferase RsmG, partial [Novosphingobium sp.]
MSIANETEALAWLQASPSVDEAAMDRLGTLVTALTEENARQNLVAQASLEQVWQRHIADSAQLLHVSRETVPEGMWL